MNIFTQKKNFKRILSIVLCAIMIFSMVQTGTLGNVQAVEVEQKFTVSVKDKYTGTVIEGADVVITASDNTATYIGTTNSEGVAEFADITTYFEGGGVAFDATYTVKATGYVDVSVTEAINIADKAGTITVEMIDNVAPSIKDVTGNVSSWTKDSIILTVVSEDADAKQYKCNEGEWQIETTFQIEKNGVYSFYIKDAAGNVSEVYAVAVAYIDKEAPTISSVTVTPDTWTKEEVMVEVTATDVGSGVTEYKMDEGEWQTSNKFPVSDDSVHKFYAKDALGNMTATAFEASADKYDNIAPIISAVTPEAGWSNTSIKFTVEATDNKSGIAYYSMDDNSDQAAWQGSAEFIITDTDEHIFYVKDNAGNISQGFKAEKAKIEKEVPSIDKVTLSTENWTNQDVTFTVMAEDKVGGSGIAAYSKDKGVTWQESNEFVISDDETHYFVVKDNAGNVSEITEKKADKYDDVAPEIKELKVDEKWTKEKVKVVVNATDDKSGVAFYRIDEGEWKTTSEFEIGDKKEHKFEVKDNAGNVSTVKTYASKKFDSKAPVLNEVKFSQENENRFAKLWNFTKYGNFFNDKLIITILAEDKEDNINNASGIATYALYFYNENRVLVHSTQPQESNVFEVNYSEVENFKGTINVEIVDNAEVSTGELAVTTDNSNIANYDEFMIEVDKPVISEINPSDSSIHKNDFDITFNISDEQVGKKSSGIAEVKVKVNGTEVLFEDFTEESSATFEKNYVLTANIAEQKINNVEVAEWNKGKLDIEVQSYDNSGNAVKSKTRTVYIDRTSPIITGFKFNLTNNIDVDSNEKGVFESVIVDDYGFYFKEKVEVTITAEDLVGEKESQASGVYSITYKAVDKDQGILFEDTRVLNDEEKKTNSITFSVDKDFKGQIYAYATDVVGNHPNDCTTCPDDKVITDGTYKGFVHPNGSILESQSKHSDTSKIEFIVPETEMSQNETSSYSYDGVQPDKELAYNINEKVPLYKENPTFGISVEDSYSGIRSVTWKVLQNDKTTDEDTITIDNEGNGANIKQDVSWTLVKDSDSNLINQVSTNITIDGAYNNMVLLVELTDRAGNVSYDYYMFGIDKSAPQVIVKMNDNDNETYDGYFNVDRTATITILERNFINENVVFTVTVTDENGVKKDIPITPEFAVNLDENEMPIATAYTGEGVSGEYYTYTMDYTFKDDGDYTFDIKATDLATRENDPVSYVNETGEDIAAVSTAFTIDKKVPTVTVVYDNISAMNKNYYKANRTATITIAEHNFVATDVRVIGTASDNNVTTTFPTTSEWKNNGNNTYTATISYTADSKYSFDIEYVDKAGNSIADYVAEEFYIDKTKPTIKITGVADKSANNGTIAPIITYTDTNMDKGTLNIRLIGVNNGKVDYTHSVKDVTNGAVRTYTNFEEVQKVDDIYTLTAYVMDMAGNQEEVVITFSANRFGSVYDLTEVKNINGKYLKEEKDVVFTETNVDALDRESILIKLTKNGTPKDLVEGEDYTVAATGGDGEWSKYTYTINKKLFADDGRYSVSIYSVDAATNVNENIDETKSAEISFGIDKTNPVVVPVDFESGVQYAVETKTVSIEIKDNLVLDGVKVYLNGKEIEYTVEGETYSFAIPEANKKQQVRVVAVDAAGNEHELLVEDFLVSTNLFVRWYNNTPLFVGSIIGVVALGVGITWFVLFGKKKKA